jgi:hypothetical protein
MKCMRLMYNKPRTLKLYTMKKTIFALAVLLTVGLTSAFAANDDGNHPNVQASFKNDFANARNISWQQAKAYTKATFTLNDQVLYAYYSNETNELLAVERNISSIQLPINLFTSLKKDYKEYWISGLFEMADREHTSYYVTLENSQETVVLKATGSSDWTVYSKTKKM